MTEKLTHNNNALKSIEGKMDKFIEQYEIDMRGDKDLENGNRGVIGEIREIKKYIRDYPSLAYLFARKPFQTIGAIIAVFVILTTLYTLGILRIIGAAIGVTLP